MTSAISAAVVADYRMSGSAELLVVSASGEVRGYIPTDPSSGHAGGLEPLSTNKRKQQVWAEHTIRKGGANEMVLLISCPFGLLAMSTMGN